MMAYQEANTKKYIKKQNRKRKLVLRSRPIETYIKRPYKKDVEQGLFRLSNYFHIKPLFIVMIYFKALLLRCAPAISYHAIMVGTNMAINALSSNPDLTLSSDNIKFITALYIICIYFGLRRASDIMSHFNNNVAYSMMFNNQSIWITIDRKNVIGPESVKEYEVAKHYRRFHNKRVLFPSKKEIQAIVQFGNMCYESKSESAIEFAKIQKERLSAEKRELEHHAAIRIADYNQREFGGDNEYDQMVKKYKKRTTPTMKKIIEKTINERHQ